MNHYNRKPDGPLHLPRKPAEARGDVRGDAPRAPAISAHDKLAVSVRA